jgi:hypothetical protein
LYSKKPADHLAEPERDDGQVVAAQAQHRQPEQDAGERGHQEPHHEEHVEHRGRQRERSAAEEHVAVRRADDGPRIGADGKERHVAEVEQTGQPHHDVEAERQRREDADLGGDLQVVAVEAADVRHHHQQSDRQQRQAQP